MATRPKSARRGERGLSLIEALVIVTVTALLALLLLPLVSRSAGRNFAMADNTLDAVEAAAAEREFRALLRAMVQLPDAAVHFNGRDDHIVFQPSVAAQIACVRPGAATPVRLRIAQDGEAGRLVCESGGRNRELLRWRGEGHFSFSADGATWSRGWADLPLAPGASVVATRAAPLVRFEVVASGARALDWIEHVGWTEAVRRRADEQ
jgi:Tfp pilus assembly protein FimT